MSARVLVAELARYAAEGEAASLRLTGRALFETGAAPASAGPKMRHLQRRLKRLEATLTDPVGLIPHSQKWIEYWDRQYYLYLTGQDPNAIWHEAEAYRAVVKYAEENPASLVRTIPRLDD